MTVALTLLLAGILTLVNWRAFLDVRDSQGFERTVALETLWRSFFAALPRAAPGILGAGPLAGGLVLAIVALAYLLVATLRLPE